MSTGHSSQGADDAQDLNQLIRYTMWSVFKAGDLDGTDRAAAGGELEALFDGAADRGVTTRGSYDVQGFRADADMMFWWIGESSEAVQEMYASFRRTRLGRLSTPVWSVVGMHRPAEFNRSHVPAFLAGEEPGEHLCIYPFVRSYEWYLLPDEERRAMLAEHGKMAGPYPDVRANTVSTFGLSDYEWMLAFEAEELHRIVDLMRHLRGAEARRHTRVEVPFYTGRRKSPAELVEALA
ncbi:hydrogen peroxide-dependent heme synthase [Streptomonospora salina]|uniref:Coproheme decarboxylase n=1 Tax=Streptomonospora salina TaxID=104205 RepID=A0A841EG00_9ACTN|nr:hydrogen peroxide-dependent heme synthase [Streptomonospora salina]MBB6001224.1 chlorite dismutase [Streptomonospora salina]